MFSPWMRATLLGLLISSCAIAQEDTLKSIMLEEVEIIGQIPEAFLAGSKVQTLNNQLLRQYSTSNLTDLIQNESAVYIKTYGNGQLGSVAFRGTSASHTALLWQGININSPTLGQSDLGTLPVFASDQVRLQFGAASALYGSDAVGGSILLEENLPQSPFSLEAYTETGSFGRYAGGTQVAYQSGKFSGKTKLYYFELKNDFSYQDSRSQTQTQNNAEVQNYGFLQQLNYQFSAQNQLSINAWYSHNNRQIQPVEGNTQAKERLFDQNLRIVADYSLRKSWGNLNIKGAYIEDEQIYQSNGESQVNAQKYVGVVEYEHHLGDKIHLRAGTNWYHTQAKSSNLQDNPKENRPSVFASLRYQVNPLLALSLNVQQTWVDGFEVPFMPSLGAEYLLYEKNNHRLTLKALAAKSYRVPTFNDRFWQPGGNPTLLPESGWNAESGLKYQFEKNDFFLESELTYYRLWINDWILWQPDGRGIWSPDNVRKVHGQGIELGFKMGIRNQQWQWQAGGNYAFTESLLKTEGAYKNKQLPYTPLHRFNLYSSITHSGFSAKVNLQYTALRYETLDNLEGFVTSIPGFMLLNGTVGKSIAWGSHSYSLDLMLNNLLNTDYQNYIFRAMPGRNYQLRFSYQF